MRDAADLTRVRRFMRALGSRARESVRVYFTGGATAVLHGWRASTIDIDVKFTPERDEIFRAVRDLKDELSINVELASPVEFIPVRSDWEERSPFIAREGSVSFHHFDLCAQVLAKIERGHAQDRVDVREFLARGLVTTAEIKAYFEVIAPQLYRYPALDEASFRRKVLEATASD
jgi:hypothetical protein